MTWSCKAGIMFVIGSFEVAERHPDMSEFLEQLLAHML